MESQEDFQEIMNFISEKFLAYIDGNSPRTKLSFNMYTSTEYDQNQKITMHNELSYSHKWPNKLFFSCMDVADTGGETLLADSRRILQAMDAAIVEEVEKKGVTYIRNLHAGKEEEIEASRILNWKKHTRGICTIELFNGGHFFINDHYQKISKMINNKLQ